MSHLPHRQHPAKRQVPRFRSNARSVPQIKSNIVLSHVYRFTSASGAAFPVTASDIIFAAGAVGTVVNTTVSAIFASARVNRVQIWSPPSAQGAFTTCALEWSGSANGNNLEVSDTSVSVAVPAMINTQPPARSLASFWLTPAVVNLPVFTMTAPVGSIIDLHLSLILSDDEIAPQTVGVATAALGKVYYLALDNQAGTHNFPPVSLTTTF
jgi:hypothetical protein